jgi:hypothetical protein
LCQSMTPSLIVPSTVYGRAFHLAARPVSDALLAPY